MLIANQSILQDDLSETLDIQYYFSPLDALRIGRAFVNRAVDIVEEFSNERHAFLVAPFGPKWALSVGSIIRREFVALATERVNDPRLLTDTLVLPTSQYLSLYSRGNKSPIVFCVKE